MIVATAGHVDHGKTLLIHALTGVDTDRLPEEKKRGMTIDLGFAYWPTSSGTTIGFIDVPGHERFIRNMLCGVAGIDFVLFVVAADDGPMPQTREHLAILHLLGVRHGAIVVTKIDRVSSERVAEVTASITSLTADTTLAGVPVFPLSALSGQGVQDLRDHLERIARDWAPRLANGNFRLAVDRSFDLVGAGLVVTGTAVSGAIRTGDQARALLPDIPVRVRGIHAQNAKADRGTAGQRCALNLAGAELRSTTIVRGDWIVAGDVAPPVQKLDVRLFTAVTEVKPLAHWLPVHVHIAAADVTGRLALLDRQGIPPGESGLAQLLLERPVGVLGGDRLIIRDQSAQRTLGGGRVIDIFPAARGRARPERLAYLAAMEESDDAVALSALLDASSHGLNLTRFLANRNLRPDEAAPLFARAPMTTVATEAGLLGFAARHWQSVRTEVLSALAAWHKRSPDTAGPAENRILSVGGARVPQEVVAAAVTELAREGLVIKEPTAVRLASHRAALTSIDAALWGKIAARLAEADLRPPVVADLAADIGESAAKVGALLARAVRVGLVVRVADTRFYLPATLARLAGLVESLAHEGPAGVVTAAAFRDKSGIGRRLAIEVLEFFDRIKFTRREGDTHRLLRPASTAVGGAGERTDRAPAR